MVHLVFQMLGSGSNSSFKRSSIALDMITRCAQHLRLACEEHPYREQRRPHLGLVLVVRAQHGFEAGLGRGRARDAQPHRLRYLFESQAFLE